ncbi:hypothetical protein DERP_002187 [Dermatophagoides pteronyssinus]|uniref:Uncharacterized protein n=1 Tax=Dermatophagoides pteronyssinus TaxID=6956 RepID=A0ABQ8J9C8_DERPT|nr:hypothetical protein DERP_011054 [Dermatophagoides pteronyssinus]KAH9418972.1 hypothetical protein DERP_011065 [Dermatophagoides pteronyssinus]KAH9421897.1 hypothetical protein DERP_002187 [Dermatophagoides pteronyssinus]
MVTCSIYGTPIQKKNSHKIYTAITCSNSCREWGLRDMISIGLPLSKLNDKIVGPLMAEVNF